MKNIASLKFEFDVKTTFKQGFEIKVVIKAQCLLDCLLVEFVNMCIVYFSSKFLTYD